MALLNYYHLQASSVLTTWKQVAGFVFNNTIEQNSIPREANVHNLQLSFHVYFKTGKPLLP